MNWFSKFIGLNIEVEPTLQTTISSESTDLSNLPRFGQYSL